MSGDRPPSLDALRRVLLSLEQDPLERDRPPLFFETGCLPAERFPVLHEQQIEENLRWAREREQRVRQHARRVERRLHQSSRRDHRRRHTHGRRQAVWCVELGRGFGSLTDAAEFVGRAPSNVSQAIRLRVKCGPYHWEHFDPAKHPSRC